MKTEWASFGEYLRYWRKQSKLSQPELAKATGTSKQNISNLERGQEHPLSGAIARPSLHLAVKLAKEIGRPLQEFLTVAGLLESGDVGSAVAEGSSKSKRNVIPSPDEKELLDRLGFALPKLPPELRKKRQQTLDMFVRDVERDVE